MGMKIAIIGTRTIFVDNIADYLDNDCDEIVSGGAKGIDTQAANLAKEKGIALTEFLPNYKRYGRAAPLIRNKEIVDYADKVLAFWDGKSKGTANTIDIFKKLNKKVTVIIENHKK